MKWWHVGVMHLMEALKFLIFHPILQINQYEKSLDTTQIPACQKF
jgi:hypothetical protein